MPTNLSQPPTFCVDTIRSQFPILSQKIHGYPLVYLDTAATSHKPACVIQAITQFYSYEYATVNRGVYTLCQKATLKYCEIRKRVAEFIGAYSSDEIIFTRGATDGINLVATSFIPTFLKQGDEVIIFSSEHHSNIVPWQMAVQHFGIKLRVVDVLENGDIELGAFEAALGPRTKLVSFAHVSNVTGAIHPAKKIIELCKSRGIYTLIDGAQSVGHMPVSVKNLGCDFFVFSSHKIYGATGLGVLFGRKSLLEQMLPHQGGGDMIENVSYEKTSYSAVPRKFEAGTPMIAQVIALGAAINFLEGIGLGVIQNYESNLTHYLAAQLLKIPGLKLLSNPKKRAPIISFSIEGMHSLDIATLLDLKGIAIRSGHLCAQPYLENVGEGFVMRVSLGVYNTISEIDFLIETILSLIGS